MSGPAFASREAQGLDDRSSAASRPTCTIAIREIAPPQIPQTTNQPDQAQERMQHPPPAAAGIDEGEQGRCQQPEWL